MEHVAKDPIIEFYLNLATPTEKPNSLPVFSETMLRLAARSILGTKRQNSEETLGLYRKILLLYYSHKYPNILDLNKIMNFSDECEIGRCLDDQEHIIAEWENFTRNYLLVDFLRKSTFFIVITEWARRYLYLYGKLSTNKLQEMASQIHTFFSWETKCLHRWIISFHSNFSKSSSSKIIPIDLKDVTEEDLSVFKIITDVKDKLHPLMYEAALKANDSKRDKENELLDLSEMEDNEETSKPLAKKRKLNSYCKKKRSKDFENVSNEEIVHIADDYNADENEGNFEGATEITLETSIEGGNDNDSVDYDEIQINVIDHDKARRYLLSLQDYAEVNEFYDALELLDQVDFLLRGKVK